MVIDGAKALAKAVRKVFGTHALVQRCTIHKRRNVTDHLPETERAGVDARLARAFNRPDPRRGCDRPASWPGRCRPATPARPPA